MIQTIHGAQTVSRVCSNVLGSIAVTSLLLTNGMVIKIDALNPIHYSGVRSDQKALYYSTPNQKRSELTVDNAKVKNLVKLHQIGLLVDNWNGDGAKAFQDTLVSAARSIVMNLDIQPEVFPTGNNAVQLEYDGPNASYLEIELREGTNADVFTIDREGNERYTTVPFSAKAINELVDHFYE